MSEKNTPDRATEFDELDDVPTYDAKEHNLYQRAGRAAPQAIDPEQDVLAVTDVSDAVTTEFKAAQFSKQAEAHSVEKQEPAVEDTQTTVIQRPEPTLSPVAQETTVFEHPDRNQRLASDAPISHYNDEDFAPAQPLAPATTVATPLNSYEQPVPVPAMESEALVVQAKRGTIDFGLALLRVVMAIYLISDSVRIFFGLGNSGGLNGFQASMDGYAMAEVLAVGIPALELAAGVFLIFGLLTPVAAAVATVVTIFSALHTLDTTTLTSYFNLPDGIWLALVVTGIALALQFTGPGIYSFDISRSWARRPLVSSWIFSILGIAAAVALWWFGAGVNPF
ncbi:DoxX family membrane protein [Corynebacterium kutscheri]|uniref:Putative membrane protein n=1 Tax=Corynebacterium kutscheri TaxID=35755 RepID=A0A0F6R013_9CORY|nr:DoxX family protein [Corynebacterium kutscheri]AKE41030.1 putative membrane protein [Corynebacterium kutscheri]VEH09328.1 hypothetical membrane protein [Corynebacterium kutscheri]